MRQETLQIKAERLLQAVFFRIVKLVDNSAGRYAKDAAPNQAVYLHGKYGFAQAFIAAEHKESGNIQRKSVENQQENPCAKQKTEKLREPVFKGVLAVHHKNLPTKNRQR